MSNIKQKILKTISDIESRDATLADELNRLRNTDEIVYEAKQLAPKIAYLNDGLESTTGPSFALETIVLRTARPVLAVSNNSAVLEFTDAKSMFWKEKLQSASSLLMLAIKAIGRIEVENHPDFDWLGTGWLVEGNIVVTNRHVANLFGKKSDSKFVFRQGSAGLIKASIDFLEEIDRIEENTFQITGILFIEDEDGPDIAFLSVAPTPTHMLPQFISLSDDVASKGQEVVVIGYPARDSRIPDQRLMENIFGDIYEKKRLAPGLIQGMNNGSLLHDCSTLGGNSGSAVLDLKTGNAIGLHFAGRFLESNFAVPATVIRESLNKLKRQTPKRSIVNRSEDPDRNGEKKPIPHRSYLQPSNNSLDVTIPVHISIRFGELVSSTENALGKAVVDIDPDEVEKFVTGDNGSNYHQA